MKFYYLTEKRGACIVYNYVSGISKLLGASVCCMVLFIFQQNDGNSHILWC